MSQTTARIIAEELIDWMTKADIGRLSNNQRLEEVTEIWEYGKWCAKGERHSLGHKSQIKFRGSRPESTAWDALVDISDARGMEIHAATVGLDRYELEILDRVYIKWQPVNKAIEAMRTGRDRFFNARRHALEQIENKLCESAQTA
jgi:hypothetical protein